jgi:hypothetical protein
VELHRRESFLSTSRKKESLVFQASLVIPIVGIVSSSCLQDEPNPLQPLHLTYLPTLIRTDTWGRIEVLGLLLSPSFGDTVF